MRHQSGNGTGGNGRRKLALLALADRRHPCPSGITDLVEQLAYLGNGGRASTVAYRQRIQHQPGKQPGPNLLAGRWFIEQVGGHEKRKKRHCNALHFGTLLQRIALDGLLVPFNLHPPHRSKTSRGNPVTARYLARVLLDPGKGDQLAVELHQLGRFDAFHDHQATLPDFPVFGSQAGAMRQKLHEMTVVPQVIEVVEHGDPPGQE